MTARKTVLFVDDDQSALTALRRALLDESYECLFALNATQALDCLRSRPIHVLVSDLCMPQTSGLALLKTVEQDYADTRLIVFSGHPMATDQLMALHLSHPVTVLHKPARPSELKTAIRRALELQDQTTPSA